MVAGTKQGRRARATDSTDPDPSTHLVEGWFTAAHSLFATNADLPIIERDHRFIDVSERLMNADVLPRILPYLNTLQSKRTSKHKPSAETAAADTVHGVDAWFAAVDTFIKSTFACSNKVMRRIARDARNKEVQAGIRRLMDVLMEAADRRLGRATST